VTAFYDIDTPVTLAALAGRGTEYISRALIPRYHLYLSFTGGPTLARLEREFDAQMARPLYCSVDTRCYYPEPADDAATAAAPSEAAGAAAVGRWDLGYLGTYSDDRQASLTELMLKPARTLTRQRFVVAGPQYPSQVAWPSNLTRIEHLSPGEHRHFYNHQRYTLNITRADMIRSGWSPSVRLFEAAACGTPIISDWWEGLDHFFEPGADILLARSAADTITCLTDVAEEERRAIGSRGRARVLARHTAAHRARELEAFALEAISAGAGR
jgi:spore maturation protein CgeB